MNRIKLLREELGMTQQDLADKLDGAKSSIAMYEKGDRKPSLEILVKLSEIFNCSIDYILCKSNIRNPEKKDNDLLDLASMGFNADSYSPPTSTQKEQIKGLLEVVLKDNKKNNEENKNE